MTAETDLKAALIEQHGTEPLYSLQDAVAKFLPGGLWTVTSLRTENKKGRLRLVCIAGKYGVTESAIREMRKLCELKGPAYISENDQDAPPLGSSLTPEDRNTALVAAKAIATGLKKRSPPISPPNTRRPKPMAGSAKPSLLTSSTST